MADDEESGCRSDLSEGGVARLGTEVGGKKLRQMIVTSVS